MSTWTRTRLLMDFLKIEQEWNMEPGGSPNS